MEYISVALGIAACILLVVLLVRKNNGDNRETMEEIRSVRKETQEEIRSSIKTLSEVLTNMQSQTTAMQDTRLKELTEQLLQSQKTLQKTVMDLFQSFDERLAAFSSQNEQKLDQIRGTMEHRLATMQEENNKKLEQMRATVDEKLQKTLEDRIGQSFKVVSERLEQVYKSLGEMQSLAVGVGDLKKVLSNVKTRGILGEIQLGSILEDILSPDQYEANVNTKKGTQNFVEYAVKLPGDQDRPVYLPIDAKFPADAYTNLMDAYDSANPAEVQAALTVLDRRIKSFAKDIRDKYISPPDTTDFAIMFLPTEGLYAEVIRRGLFEAVQREFHVVVAGPTNMAALLNSLQMGFKTLAIQKRSGEVWNILGAVKTEFDKFGTVLQAAQAKIEMANSEIDKLVGVRTRQIQRKLRSVTSLPEEEAVSLLEDDSSEP